MFCNHCGLELENSNSKFCPNCGKRVGGNQTQDHMMNGVNNVADRVLSDRNMDGNTSVMTIVALILEAVGVALFFIGCIVVLGTGGHPFWGAMVFFAPVLCIIGWIIGRTEYKKNENDEYTKLANKTGKIIIFIIVAVAVAAIFINMGMAMQYYGE